MTTPAFVQQIAGAGNAVSTTALTATTTATHNPGSLLVACVATNGVAGDTGAITDNSTQPGDVNVWQYVFTFFTVVGGNTALHIFTCTPTRRIFSGDVISLTLSANTSRKSILVLEYSGFQRPLVQLRAHGTGTATTIASQSLTPKEAAGALMAFCFANNTGSTTGQTTTGPTNGFNLRLGANNSGGGTVTKEATICDKVVSGAPAAQQTSPTDVSTVGWIGAMLAIAEADDITYKVNRGRYAT